MLSAAKSLDVSKFLFEAELENFEKDLTNGSIHHSKLNCIYPYQGLFMLVEVANLPDLGHGFPRWTQAGPCWSAQERIQQHKHWVWMSVWQEECVYRERKRLDFAGCIVSSGQWLVCHWGPGSRFPWSRSMCFIFCQPPWWRLRTPTICNFIQLVPFHTGQGWSVWLEEYGRSDGVLLTKSGSKRHYGFRPVRFPYSFLDHQL